MSSPTGTHEDVDAAASVQQVAELIARDEVVAVISGAADAAAAGEQH
jgi:hypothetical protein